MNRANFAIEHQQEVQGDPFGKIKPYLSNDITNDTRMRYGSELRVLPDVAHSYGSARDNGDEERVFAVGVPFRGEDPCWEGYEMIGMKKKKGKSVPNCVPKGVGEGKPFTNKQLTKIILDKNKVITDLEENAYGEGFFDDVRAGLIKHNQRKKDKIIDRKDWEEQMKEGNFEKPTENWGMDELEGGGNGMEEHKQTLRKIGYTEQEIDAMKLGDNNYNYMEGEGFFDDVKRDLDIYNQRMNQLKGGGPIQSIIQNRNRVQPLPLQPSPLFVTRPPSPPPQPASIYGRPTYSATPAASAASTGAPTLPGAPLLTATQQPFQPRDPGAPAPAPVVGVPAPRPFNFTCPAEYTTIIREALNEANMRVWRSTPTTGIISRPGAGQRTGYYQQAFRSNLRGGNRPDNVLSELFSRSEATLLDTLAHNFKQGTWQDNNATILAEAPRLCIEVARICNERGIDLAAELTRIRDIGRQNRSGSGGAEPAKKPSVAAVAEALKPVREAIQNGIGDALYGAEDDPKKQRKGLLGISEEQKEESRKKVNENIVKPLMKNIVAPLLMGAVDVKDIIFNPDAYKERQKERRRIDKLEMDQKYMGIFRNKEGIIMKKPRGSWGDDNGDEKDGERLELRKGEDFEFYVRIPNPIKAAGLRPSGRELELDNIKLWDPVTRRKDGNYGQTLREIQDDDFIFVPEADARRIYGELRGFVEQEKGKELATGFEELGWTKEQMKDFGRLGADFKSFSPQEKRDYLMSKNVMEKQQLKNALDKVDKDIADEEAKKPRTEYWGGEPVKVGEPDQARLAKMRDAKAKIIKLQENKAKEVSRQTKADFEAMQIEKQQSEAEYYKNLAKQGAESQASYQSEQADFAALPASERIAILNGNITQMENEGTPEYQIEEAREQVRAIELEQESDEVQQQAQTSVDLLQQAEVAEGGGHIISKANRGAPEPPQPPVRGVQQHLNPPPPVAGIPVACSPAHIAIIEEALLEANTSAYESRWEVMQQGHPGDRVQGEIQRGYMVGFRFALNRWVVNELGYFMNTPAGSRIVMALLPLSNAERINYLRGVAGEVCLIITQDCIRNGLDVAEEMATIRRNTESFRRAMAGRGRGGSGDLEGGGAVEYSLQKAGKSLFNPTGDMSHAGRQTFTPDWDAYGSDAANGRKNAFELSRSMYNQSKALDIVGFKLVKDDTSLRFYQKEDEQVIMVGIRGTDVHSYTDLYTWAVIGAKQDFRMTTRFQDDLQKLIQFQKNYPMTQFYYVGTGSSLAGSIADRFLDLDLIEEAVTYNPSIEKKYVLDDAIHNHRIYLDTDPLFILMGQYAPNTEIRVNANKANYYNPSKEGDYLAKSHSIYPVYNPAFEGGGMEGSGKTYTLEEWKEIFDAKLEQKRQQIEARAAKKKDTAKAKRERAKVRRDEMAEIPELETPFRPSRVMKATPPKQREPEPEPEPEEEEVETTKYKVDDNTVYVEDAREGVAFEDRMVFDDEDNEIGTLAEFREIAKKVFAKEKPKEPKAPKKPRLKVVAPKISALMGKFEAAEEAAEEQPRNPAGEFAVAVVAKPQKSLGLPTFTEGEKRMIQNLQRSEMTQTQKAKLLARSGIAGKLMEMLAMAPSDSSQGVRELKEIVGKQQKRVEGTKVRENDVSSKLWKGIKEVWKKSAGYELKSMLYRTGSSERAKESARDDMRRFIDWCVASIECLRVAISEDWQGSWTINKEGRTVDADGDRFEVRGKVGTEVSKNKTPLLTIKDTKRTASDTGQSGFAVRKYNFSIGENRVAVVLLGRDKDGNGDGELLVPMENLFSFFPLMGLPEPTSRIMRTGEMKLEMDWKSMPLVSSYKSLTPKAKQEIQEKLRSEYIPKLTAFIDMCRPKLKEIADEVMTEVVRELR